MGKFAKTRWRVGELAQEAGLTVRTLLHYDQIGLLKPSAETEGGHRVYGPADVERLQQIITCKHLGFSLEETRAAIDAEGFSLPAATARLRADVEKRRSHLADIEERLRDVERISGDHRAEHVLQLLSRMNLFERHLPADERASIRQHDLEFGPRELAALKPEWIAATERVEAARRDGADPADWRVKAVCMRWFGLACAFSGGTLDGPYDLKRIVDTDAEAARHLGLPGIDLRETFAFVNRVLRASVDQPLVRAIGWAEVGVGDLARAKEFYDRALAPLDVHAIFRHPREIVYGVTNPELFVREADDAGPGVGQAHVFGFFTSLDERVDQCFAAALAAGGTAVDAPARKNRHQYQCTFRDPDGNAIKILHWTDDPDRPTG